MKQNFMIFQEALFVYFYLVAAEESVVGCCLEAVTADGAAADGVQGSDFSIVTSPGSGCAWSIAVGWPNYYFHY